MSSKGIPLLAFAGFLLCILLHAMADEAMGGGYFLVGGVGLEGRLQVGGPVPGDSHPDEEGWHHFGNSEISFKEAGGRVAIIRCEQYCLTNRNISIGSHEREVFRRYGSPAEERLLGGERFLVYPGVGFTIGEEDSVVEAIYIFPVFREKK